MSRRVVVAFALAVSIAHAAPQSPTASVISSASIPAEDLDMTQLAQDLGIDVHKSAAVDKEIEVLKNLILPAVEKFLPSQFAGVVQPILGNLKKTLVKSGPTAMLKQLHSILNNPMVANILNNDAPSVNETCVEQKATGALAKTLTPAGIVGSSAFCPGFCGMLPEEVRAHKEMCSCCDGVEAASGCASFCELIPGPEDVVLDQLFKGKPFDIRSFVSDCSTCPASLKIPSDACTKLAALAVPVPAALKKLASSTLKCPCKNWCAKHSKGWPAKCKWKNCNGCEPC